ncbi:MAG: ABC transporter substrate-binding protein [Beijerinckiaceae bacterium]|nr:ABC transporter substrate-binding protein [Beijerinckiaceae bacterium]
MAANILRTLVVSTFPNAKALPLWAEVEHGLFARNEIALRLHETGSSDEQRDALSKGDVHIAQAALDNGVAMIVAGEDVVIVMGGEGGMNDFIVQPHICSFEDLRGRVLAVDSPFTAYALLARRALSRQGLSYNVDYQMKAIGNGSRRLRALLEDRTLAGAVLNPPFSAEALMSGMKSLGRLNDMLGPYQAGGAYVMRPWANANRSALVAFIRGYVESLRWICSPEATGACEKLLASKLDLAPDLAAATLAQLRDPSFGFSKDALLSVQGMANMLAIRAETEGGGSAHIDVRRIVDASFYDEAMRALTPA